MNRSKIRFISLASICLSFITANAFANETPIRPEYIELGNKFITCTPTTMTVPNPLVDGTQDKYTIKGKQDDSCIFSIEMNIPEMGINVTRACTMPMANMQTVASDIKEMAYPPKTNQNFNRPEDIYKKYCKNINNNASKTPQAEKPVSPSTQMPNDTNMQNPQPNVQQATPSPANNQ